MAGEAERWIVGVLNPTVQAEVDALPGDVRASFHRIGGMIQEFGLGSVREPHVKHIEGRLWEMRLRGRDGIARALYVTATGKRIVVLRVFVKKTEKTPPREMKLALQRAKEIP